MSQVINISEIDVLKLIYFEILDGFSYDPKSSLYIKHFSDKDSHSILKKRTELFYYYEKEGVPHESYLLKTAIDNEEWSKDKEEQILQLKYEISDNERNLPNLIYQQRPIIEKIINERKKQLSEILFERKQVLGRNIEDLIDDDVNDYVIYLSFYKDSELTEHVEKTYEDFQLWEPTNINELGASLSEQYKKFSEDNLKGIASLPMFLNKLTYVKNDISKFLNKSISSMSHHQSYLFSLGTRNLNVRENTKGSPPDLNLDAKIKDVAAWYDLHYSLNIGKRNQQETV